MTMQAFNKFNRGDNLRIACGCPTPAECGLRAGYVRVTRVRYGHRGLILSWEVARGQ